MVAHPMTDEICVFFLYLLTTFIHLVILILITSHVGVCQLSLNVKSFPPFILIGILRGNILALYQASIQQCWPLHLLLDSATALTVAK